MFYLTTFCGVMCKCFTCVSCVLYVIFNYCYVNILCVCPVFCIFYLCFVPVGGSGEEARRRWGGSDGEDAERLQNGVRAALSSETPQHHRSRWRDYAPGDLCHAVLQSGKPHGAS